jgi:hypothetical protein
METRVVAIRERGRTHRQITFEDPACDQFELAVSTKEAEGIEIGSIALVTIEIEAPE